MKRYFITGTDTDCGKTIAAVWLALQLDGVYWKPIQSGLEQRDVDTFKALTGFDDTRILHSIHELTQPLSPHEAAKRDGVRIDLEGFALPETDRQLVIEGAGGLMVPLNDKHLVIDLIKHLNCPAILVCRSTLGTINHTLLSLEALRARSIPVAGLIINGPKSPHNRQALEEYGRVPVIAEIDYLDPVSKESLLSIQPEIEL